MKLKLKATPEQIELIKAAGQRDETESRKAQEMLAAAIAPIILKVLQQAGTTGAIFTEVPYDEDSDPSILLDQYYDKTSQGTVMVWSQSVAGGMPTSRQEQVAEMKVSTYRLDSAVSFGKKFARRSRLDVIANAVNRMAQEILLKRDRNKWAVILRALAEATTNSLSHVLTANTENVFLMDDLSRAMTRMRRISSSWAGGTSTDSFGITDAFISPEVKQQIRGFAYSPANTTAGVLSGTSTAGYTSTAIPLPEATRERIFAAGGATELWGVTLTELNELGVNQKYNTLFGAYSKANMGKKASTFATADDELIVFLDLSREGFISPIAQNADSGNTVTTLVDDQFTARSDEAGFYTSLEEGACAIDARTVAGLVL